MKTDLKNCIKIWNVQNRLEDYEVSKTKNSTECRISSDDGWHYLLVLPGKLKLYKSIFDEEILEFSVISLGIKEIKLLISKKVARFQLSEKIKYSALWQEIINYSESNPESLLFLNTLIGLNSPFYGPQFVFDRYYQPGIPFKNLIECLAKNEYDNLSESALNLCFTEYKYSILHVFAFSGYYSSLQKALIPSSLISTDIFGKSPIFYSINKKFQNCTNLILEYLISLKPDIFPQAKSSFYSLRNDIFLIIQNSSKYLPDILDSIVTCSSIFMIPEDSINPDFTFNPFSKPRLSDFKLGSSFRETPALFKTSALKFDAAPFSLSNIKALESIKSCLNDRIYDTLLIKSYIDYNWQAIYGIAKLHSILLILNVATFINTLQYNEFDLVSVIIFLSSYFYVFAWEFNQIYVLGTEYFKDYWNYIDLFTIFTVIYWTLSLYFGFGTEYEKYLLALFIMTRGLTAFRMIDGTRYYVDLIISSIGNIKYFLILFFYSTLFFSVLFTISRGDDLTLNSLWDQSWQLNFGEHVSLDNCKNYALTYISIFAATIVNVVLMLNMLISILGDSYDNFLLQKTAIDYKEKLSMSLEIQKVFLYFKNRNNKKLYLQVLTTPLDDEDATDDWQGKILYMEKRQERRISSIGENVNEKIDGLQKKIELFNEKIDESLGGFEGKMVEIVESKMKVVENRISERLEKIEGDLKTLIEFIRK